VATLTGRFFGFFLIFIGVWQVLAGALLNGLAVDQRLLGGGLESAAASQLQQQVLKDLLAGHRVSEMMGRDCARVPGDLMLQELSNRTSSERDRRFVVMRGDQTIGFRKLQRSLAPPGPRQKSSRLPHSLALKQVFGR
jgi:hypothetical protein